MTSLSLEQVAVVILAGGQSQRMGQAKALLELNNKPLLQYLIERFQHQVEQVVIAGCPQPDLYQAFSVPVIADDFVDRGPLQGICSAMDYFRQAQPGLEAVLCVPCDGVDLPDDFEDRMLKSLGDNDLVFARDSQRDQQLYCLLKIDLLASLQQYLREGGRRVIDYFAGCRYSSVEFSENSLGNDFTFANFNTQDDWNAYLQQKTQEK